MVTGSVFAFLACLQFFQYFCLCPKVISKPGGCTRPALHLLPAVCPLFKKFKNFGLPPCDFLKSATFCKFLPIHMLRNLTDEGGSCFLMYTPPHASFPFCPFIYYFFFLLSYVFFLLSSLFFLLPFPPDYDTKKSLKHNESLEYLGTLLFLEIWSSTSLNIFKYGVPDFCVFEFARLFSFLGFDMFIFRNVNILET